MRREERREKRESTSIASEREERDTSIVLSVLSVYVELYAVNNIPRLVCDEAVEMEGGEGKLLKWLEGLQKKVVMGRARIAMKERVVVGEEEHKEC